jgi:hypothetical protein
MLLTNQQTIRQNATETTTGSVEHLQSILVTKTKRNISYDEACGVGDALIEFYQILATEYTNEPVS